MEPNKRLPSYTDMCRRAARGLFWLLREIELHPDRAAELAPYRSLFCTQSFLDPLAVDVIRPPHHRGGLHPIHPLALTEEDPLRCEPGVMVGDGFDPLAHLMGVLGYPAPHDAGPERNYDDPLCPKCNSRPGNNGGWCAPCTNEWLAEQQRRANENVTGR